LETELQNLKSNLIETKMGV